MGQRLQLHNLLIEILGSDKVYFQPPETKKILYPCIIYKRNKINSGFANNKPYVSNKQYQIMVVDPDPDSLIPYKIKELSTCSFDRHYTKDNLNYDVYNLYY